MPAWTADEIAKIGNATELQIASRRRDGSLRPYVTIWVVRSGDELFVRSAYGHENGWFRRALTSGTGRIRYGPAIVGTVVSPEAARSTLRLVPQLASGRATTG
jgi:hypothetical protein